MTEERARRATRWKRMRPWLLCVCLGLDLGCSMALPLAPAGMAIGVFGIAVGSTLAAFGLVWWAICDREEP